MESLQSRIKTLRGEETQAQFAERLAVPVNTLGRYERGINTPNLDFLIKLHDIFGVSLDWIVFGKRNKWTGRPGHAVIAP